MVDQRKRRRALKAIAEIILWDEPITDPRRKKTMTERGEYDVEEDHFTPTFYTVNVYL